MKNLKVRLVILIIMISILIPELVLAEEKMVNTGKYNLNCVISGKGGPSIILISGLGRDHRYWKGIIPALSSFTTVFAYDSLNMGKSDKGKYPQAGDDAVKDLQIILEKNNIPKPYILVGHSYGGLFARLFAGTYPKDTAGLILVDATPLGLEQAILNVLDGKEKVDFAKFMTMRPPAMKRTQELIEKIKYPQIPLIVLNAGKYNSLTSYSPETRKKTKAATQKLGREMAEIIPGGKGIIVKGAGHGIHIEKPQIVIDAIKEVYGKIKK